MSVLLCLARRWCQHRAKAPSGLGRWDKQFPQCVPHQTRAAKPRAVKTLFHFSVRGLQRAHGFHRTGPPWGQRARGFAVGMDGVRIPGSRLRASAGAVVPSHRVTQPGANRTRGLQAVYLRGRAHRRKQGIRAGYGFLEIREGSGSCQHQAFGVSGPGGFHSSVWRSATHVAKRAARCSANALCRPSILCAGASACAVVPSDGSRPGDSAHVGLRWVWAACVSQEAGCVRQRARWFHRTGSRSRAPAAHAVCRPGIRAALRIDGNRVSARGTGFWKCARQLDLISIRLWASAGQVCFIRVCGAGLRPSTTGLRSPVPRHFAQ